MLRSVMALLLSAATAIAAVALFPAAASAQQTEDEVLALPAMHLYATCVVRDSQPGAEKLLQMDVGTPEYQETLRAYALSHPHCVPGRKLQFGGLPFAGAVAEALILERYSGRNVADLIAQAAPESDLPPHGMAEGVGMCVARAKPELVKAVLDTDPGSQQEVQALDQTGPALTGCIHKGTQITLNKQAARAMYALGAWRLINDKGAPPIGIGG
jgi:hypothetical protein